MKKISILLISILCIFKYNAQNISGVINSYASVTTISGTGITVASAGFLTGDHILLIQMKGATIDASNTSGFGDITSFGGAGTYEFLSVSSVSANLLTVSSTPTHTYDVASGFVQVVRVPRYCRPIVTSVLTCEPWSGSNKSGGILAFEADTLRLNEDIDVSAKGFAGGNFVTGTFGCDNGNYTGSTVLGAGGGKKGESISAYINNLNGLKGKQANGGGGANSGNSGGGGGANVGAGGFGGNQYSGCTSGNDERGIGGVSIGSSLSKLFMGGGGGGGFEDNGMVATNGGNGGGIIYIKANVIIANNYNIASNGGSVTIFSDAEGAGGGGAGGSVFIECNNISGQLNVKTNGGSGGSNNNSAFVVACHGTGGGGGGGAFAFSASSTPPNVSYSSLGGLAGIVSNTASACYNTTNGATAGTSGTLIPSLAFTPVTLNRPTLSSVQSNTIICRGEPATITVSGASTYSWNTGVTTAAITVTPTSTRMYTVTGYGGANSCEATLTASLEVSLCLGITTIGGNGQVIKLYPNPTNGKFSIETQIPVKLVISDETGRRLQEHTFQKGEHNMDLSNYAAGIYFIKASDDMGTQVIKLIKTD